MRARNFINPIPLLLIGTFISSCDKISQKRQYTEIVISSPTAAMTMSANDDPHAFMKNIPMHDSLKETEAPKLYSWEMPVGWHEQAANGMRLAMFSIENPVGVGECTIVSLAGEAGSLEANIDRWAKQINIELTENELSNLISSHEHFSTVAGFAVDVVDFTPQAASSTQKSIIAAIIKVSGQTVFIKIAGPQKTLTDNREKFINLCKSFKSHQ